MSSASCNPDCCWRRRGATAAVLADARSHAASTGHSPLVERTQWKFVHPVAASTTKGDGERA
jgi:hypothetical protein